LAALALRREGFILQVDELKDGKQLLLAENPYFILCLASADGARSIPLTESLAATHLARRLASVKPGAKKWDAYVVVMTGDKFESDPAAVARVYGLSHNTSEFRRVLRAGVEPDLDQVEAALRLFMPVTKLEEPILSGDPLDDLKVELARRGLAVPDAQRLVDEFRSLGTITDA
jgi:hypothetical protein